jgi:hypothetical protein
MFVVSNKLVPKGGKVINVFGRCCDMRYQVTSSIHYILISINPQISIPPVLNGKKLNTFPPGDNKVYNLELT